MTKPAFPPIPSPLGPEHSRRRPLVSLTPLIDVVFILLIFFMLASSFLDWRTLEVMTPAPGNPASSPDKALVVELLADGRWLLGGQTLDPQSLQQQIAKQIARHPELTIMVRPEEGVLLQTAIDVLDRLRAAGASKVSLVRGRTP